jgi:tRNA nucleotidyltransferase (CCA-adding enzyme)
VRDALLGRPVRDVDLVVEGDGIAFARALARRLRVPWRAHPRFGTATLSLADGSSLDVATARAETYAHPGALPRVAPGNLSDDLARRDFSVNAMALRLFGESLRLEDPHGGRADLERGHLRVLHPGSASDDPTRAFRAVLYANRLGLRIDAPTRRSIREALRSGHFARISGERTRHEIARLLSETGRARAVSALSRLGILEAVHPALPGDAATASRLRRAERLEAASGRPAGWFAYLLVWAATLDEAQAASLAERWRLPRAQARVLRSWPQTLRRAAASPAGLAPPPGEDERFALRALAPRAAAEPVEPRVRGRDLVAAGLPPGPAIGRALASVRAALAIGRIGPDEELAYALDAARREGRS